MKGIKFCAYLFIACFFLTAFFDNKGAWGFFAHRRINRLAVFTLHSDIIGFYKKHIEYLTAHATDPDMRRYVVPIEGQKHFIDLDRWQGESLPTTFREIRRLFTEIVIIGSIIEVSDSFDLYEETQKCDDILSHNQGTVVQYMQDFRMEKALEFLKEQVLYVK